MFTEETEVGCREGVLKFTHNWVHFSETSPPEHGKKLGNCRQVTKGKVKEACFAEPFPTNGPVCWLSADMTMTRCSLIGTNQRFGTLHSFLNE
jgi:hypothetical protein